MCAARSVDNGDFGGASSSTRRSSAVLAAITADTLATDARSRRQARHASRMHARESSAALAAVTVILSCMHVYGGERACACKDDAVGNGNQQPDRSRTRNYFLSVTCDVRTKTNFTLYRAPPHGGGGQSRVYHVLSSPTPF